MKAVVLAAGRGTRLAPVTADRSKAMVPVLGRPLVEWVLETLVANDLHNVVMVIGPEDARIREYLTATTSLDLRVEFVVQAERLGMAHALRLARTAIDGPFLLSACDSLKPVDHVADLLAAAREADGALSLMEVPLERVSTAAPVVMDDSGLIHHIVEKPRPEEAPSSIVSLPLYVLPDRILDLLEEQGPSTRGEYEVQDGIQGLIDEGARIVGVTTRERLQVSNPTDLLDLNVRKLRERGASVIGTELPRGTTVVEPVWIDPGVAVGPECRIGPDAVLERGSSLGTGVAVTRSLVLRGALVPDGLRLDGQVVTAEADGD